MSDQNMLLPKIIHYLAPTNKADWNKKWFKCNKSWLEKFKANEFEHRYYDFKELELFFSNHYCEYLEFYKNIKLDIVKLDFARFCLVEHFGGMYVDMDVFCFNNFFYDLIGDVVLFAGWKKLRKKDLLEEYVGNYMFASKPKNIFLKNFINNQVELYKKYGDNLSTEQYIFFFSPIEFSRFFLENHNNYNNIQYFGDRTEHSWLHQELWPHGYGDQNLLKTLHLSTKTWHRSFYKFEEQQKENEKKFSINNCFESYLNIVKNNGNSGATFN
jgi:hypothetical protein